MDDLVTIDIYFRSLDEDTQEEILEQLEVDGPEDLNWDVMPMTTIEVPKGKTNVQF